MLDFLLCYCAPYLIPLLIGSICGCCDRNAIYFCSVTIILNLATGLSHCILNFYLFLIKKCFISYQEVERVITNSDTFS